MKASLLVIALAVSVFVLFEKSVKSNNNQSAAVLKPPHIVVLRGYIEQQQRCIANETIPNFMKCFVACAKMESCQLSYFSEKCTLCSNGVFIPDSSALLIGMKNVHNMTENLCPDVPTAFNYTSHNSENTTTTLFISPTETTRTTSTCPEGYKMFQRRNVNICLGVEYDVKTFTKTRGMEICSNIGGFISGPDSPEERDYLKDNVMKKMESSITAFMGVGIWIDGDKKKECVELIVTKLCQNITAFDVSDKTMQRLGGYHFFRGQPDGILGRQMCVQMMVTKNDQNGFLDDQGCLSLYGYGVQSLAVACAKIIS